MDVVKLNHIVEKGRGGGKIFSIFFLLTPAWLFQSRFPRVSPLSYKVINQAIFNLFHLFFFQALVVYVWPSFCICIYDSGFVVKYFKRASEINIQDSYS